jgi:hypothetical protein
MKRILVTKINPVNDRGAGMNFFSNILDAGALSIMREPQAQQFSRRLVLSLQVFQAASRPFAAHLDVGGRY